MGTNLGYKSCFYLVIGLMAVLTLIACGGSGGGGGGGGDETPTTYQLYDDGYYVAGYAKSITLSGDDSDDPGTVLTGSYTISTGAQVDVSGESAIPVTITLTVTGASTSSLIHYYKASDTGDDKERIRIADVSGDPSFTPRAGTVAPLADTASIGDSGTMTTFDGSDGTIVEESWSLVAGDGGMADLVITTQVKDASEVLQYTEEVTTTIDESGDPQSVQIETTYPSGRVVTLSGDFAS